MVKRLNFHIIKGHKVISNQYRQDPTNNKWNETARKLFELS